MTKFSFDRKDRSLNICVKKIESDDLDAFKAFSAIAVPIRRSLRKPNGRGFGQIRVLARDYT